jgi:Cation efflux family
MVRSAGTGITGECKSLSPEISVPGKGAVSLFPGRLDGPMACLGLICHARRFCKQLAWWAAWLGRRHPTRSRTYGYGRSSILASLTNAVVMLVGVGGITVESVRRLIDGVPSGEVGGKTVMIVAAAGSEFTNTAVLI